MKWYDVLPFVVSLLTIGAAGWWAYGGKDERGEEDSARLFYDEHGHWPDEDPSEADRRYEL